MTVSLMSSGAFSYPLCFSAMIAVIGLFVSSLNQVPATSAAERAAYKEIISLWGASDLGEIQEKCERFLKLYPHSKGAEHVAVTLGESLVQNGNWKEAGKYYCDLEARFPKSEFLERFVFFQGMARFMEADFTAAIPQFKSFLKIFPKSPLVENASYYVAMSHFMSNDYEEALVACKDHLEKFPGGQFAGDMIYRRAFIDFNDKNQAKDDKIIRDLNGFLEKHPDAPANGSLYCLLADTYKRKKSTTDDEAKTNEDKAIETYIKAVWTDSPDDVIQYALESATNLIQARKDWAAIADLHAEFLKKKPDSQLALVSVSWVAKMKARLGKPEEASEILANALNATIGDPAKEQVEFLIDELVKTIVPREKPQEIDHAAVDKQLVELLHKAISGRENVTTALRTYYARARLAEMLKRRDLADLYLKGIATLAARDPTRLSPKLLAENGDMLLKTGDLKGAEIMFKRLVDRYSHSMFSDAGPVGLGYIALARKKPEEALRIFENALKKPNNRYLKEAKLGKLQALVEHGRLDEAEKLAAEIISDTSFRGESAAKAQFLLARIYREQAANQQGAAARDLLAKAHAIYIRVFLAYKSFLDLSAEAIWQASEVAREMGDEELRLKNLKNLKDLLDEPKLKDAEPYKKAATEAK